ncbi:MAG: hypothetical protein U0470_13090 [Anaerolineae bacterium]
MNSQIFVPGLRLNLDTGVLVGSGTRRATWRSTADRFGRADDLHVQRRQTDIQAIFTVAMADPSGERLQLKQGDIVRVVPAGADAAETLEMVIPELSVAFDEQADSISGRATPGGHLDAQRGRRHRAPRRGRGPRRWRRRRGQRNADSTINADGTWDPDVRSPAVQRPAGHVGAS